MKALVTLVLAAIVSSACASTKAPAPKSSMEHAWDESKVNLTVDSQPPFPITFVETQARSDIFLFSLLSTEKQVDGAKIFRASLRIRLDALPVAGKVYDLAGDELKATSDANGGDATITGTVRFTVVPNDVGNGQFVTAEFSAVVDGKPFAGKASGVTWSCVYASDCHESAVPTVPE